MERHEPSVESQGNQPVPPELREEAIKKILEESPNMENFRKEQMTEQMRRNGRWGTCVDCPDDQGRTYGASRSNKVMPENCPETDRYDHWLGIDALDEK
ncbi:TPA: hypothetical protein DF272_03160 [Candidatus Falkowbacteria bacterium]|nr:hypothetical protein [Candidatus Falkowbacteria bacterium]